MADRGSTSPPQPSRTRESVRFSNPNIFSDEFALEPLQVTDDNQNASADIGRNDDATPSTPRRSLSFQRSFDSAHGSLRRSRLSQRSYTHNSVSSRTDDQMSQSSPHPRSVTSVSDSGNTDSTQHQSVRTISTFGFPRAQSPYQGATGPSQPYGMYSQDVGPTRTPSIATVSTIRRPERTYSGPSGPTQPYGMYAQNTVPEDDVGNATGIVPPIITAFPGSGSGHNYQRRLGPDGEDVDDLIGPDGYAEQLPPYSRYANGIPPKYTSGIRSISGSSRRTIPPAPQENFQETLNNTQSRDVSPANPFADSSTQVSPTASVPDAPKDEGGHFKERFQKKARKKVCCGMPCWICVVLVVASFLAVLLGGAMGGLVGHRRGEQKGRQEVLQTLPAQAAAPTATVTQTSPPDAISLSYIPSNLPALPTGSYAVTLSHPMVSTNSCLTTDGQACAWDCSTNAKLTMDVSTKAQDEHVVSLTFDPGPSEQIQYGSQPPELEGNIRLKLMKDKDAFNKGPAYFFSQPYNKTVIVHNQDLPNGLPGSKRRFMKRWFGDDADDDADDSQSQWTDLSLAVPTDKPWYCFWNGTILEGFIFVTQDVPVSSSQTSPGLSPYPKLVKIEERRNYRNSVQPYCQQMQILNNYQPGPLEYPDSQQLVQIQLTESEPPYQSKVRQQQLQQQAAEEQEDNPPTNNLLRRRHAIGRRDISSDTPMCRCEWMSTL